MAFRNPIIAPGSVTADSFDPNIDWGDVANFFIVNNTNLSILPQVAHRGGAFGKIALTVNMQSAWVDYLFTGSPAPLTLWEHDGTDKDVAIIVTGQTTFLNDTGVTKSVEMAIAYSINGGLSYSRGVFSQWDQVPNLARITSPWHLRVDVTATGDILIKPQGRNSSGVDSTGFEFAGPSLHAFVFARNP